MIEIKPKLDCHFNCPECHSELIKVKELKFPGIRVLADCVCNNCGFQFLNDLPVGHALTYPMKLGKENFKLYDSSGMRWFSELLVNSYQNQNNGEITIERRIIKEYSEVIMLNCLDYLYGHVLLKLFNAQFYLEKYKNKGIVILIPKSFEWLIPADVSEVWLVDIKLRDAKNWMNSIDLFVKENLNRYTKVYLSPVYSHPELHKIDISIFTKTLPFDLNLFTEKPVTFTFIYREDRLWHSNYLENFLFRVLFKLKLLKYMQWYFLGVQSRKIKKLFVVIKRNLPGARLNLVGIGKFGTFPEFVTDLRTKTISTKTEKDWCAIYAQSHIVAGIHGSNMLIPTALAAAFIEILPSDRIGNITQDVFAKYNNRQMLYLGRFLYEYVTVNELAKHCIKILKEFKTFKENTQEEFLKY